MRITKKILEDLINQNDKFKNAYFWTPPANASSRRSYEEYNSRNIIGKFHGHDLDLTLNISCSCKNIYVSRSFYVDGVKCTITKIKNMLKKKMVKKPKNRESILSESERLFSIY